MYDVVGYRTHLGYSSTASVYEYSKLYSIILVQPVSILEV